MNHDLMMAGLSGDLIFQCIYGVWHPLLPWHFHFARIHMCVTHYFLSEYLCRVCCV